MKIKTRELYKLVIQTQPSQDSDLPKVRLIIYYTMCTGMLRTNMF